jgi:GWxTD domain-containing protein
LKNKLFYIILISFAFLIGCSASQNTSNQNVAGIYMDGLNLINPDLKVFHKNDTLTELHFRFNSENILYTRKRGDSTFSANILIHYDLMDRATDQLLDSASINFTDLSDNKIKKLLDGVINLPTQPSKSYTIKVKFSDLSRDHFIKKSILLNRLNIYNAQNYLFVDSLGNVFFNDYYKVNDQITILKNESNTNESLLVKYYSTNLPLARPPFASDESKDTPSEYTPKFSKSLYYDSLNTIIYNITEKGLYHFQASETNKEGPTLFNFEANFPLVKNLDNMVGPMRYISSKKEYTLLKNSEDKKVAMDNFWLEVAGSNDRARTLITEYFGRVEKANEHFTSYLEGWKTDRGIIYVIYGAPNVVYKNKEYENWIYGEENNMMSTSFIFYKVKNPVSNNDFKLNRSTTFKSSWYRAVDSWRSGRIY